LPSDSEERDSVSSGARRDFSFDATAQRPIRHVQVVASLEVNPELRRSPEITSQTKGGISGDPTATEHNVVDA
jgi:hypothetical protein